MEEIDEIEDTDRLATLISIAVEKECEGVQGSGVAYDVFKGVVKERQEDVDYISQVDTHVEKEGTLVSAAIANSDHTFLGHEDGIIEIWSN